MTPGVYLVGAGPGHPGLITVRGQECLAAADVVVYDHPVSSRLLRHARKGAEQIDVGQAAPQPLEQEAICYLLADKAREGKVVVRLKWGDPFIFDRSGPEALFLKQHGIPLEVVPGIPVALGSATYAGVPLTYPGGGDTLTFVRGHEDAAGSLARVDWASLAQLDGTIVWYTGPGQATQIAQTLIDHGRNPDDRAALVSHGTLPNQRTTTASLAELAGMGDETRDERTAVLIVGRVAAFRDHLRWFDRRPLFGTRVLITRARDQAPEIVAAFEALGAETIEAPMIRIAPPEDYGPLDAACARAASYSWIVFSSANAVDSVMHRLLASSLDARALHGARLCVVGPATRDRLAHYGLKADAMPAEYRAEALAEVLTAQGPLAGARVLLPRADIGRDVIATSLRRQGADVTEVIAYRTLPADPEREGGPDVYRLLLERRVDVVTFTSASAVHNMVSLLGAEPAADLLGGTVVAAIGPVTAEAAALHHITATIVPSEYTVPALARAVAEYMAERS